MTQSDQDQARLLREALTMPTMDLTAGSLDYEDTGGLILVLQALRLRPLRRLPITFGWMSKRPLPDELVDRWLRPAQSNRAIRRDLRDQPERFAHAIRAFVAAAPAVWTAPARAKAS